MAKVVVFDLGKVLVDFDYGISAAKMAPLCGLTRDEIQHAMQHSPLLYQYESAQLTTAQFFTEVCRATGYRGNADDFRATFADIFSEIPEMIALQQRLRAAGVPTYIFSNTNEIAIGHIRARFPFFSHFDGYIFSYEHGAMKPDPRLYAVVERVAQHRGTDVLYVDDRPENIETGAARGWQAILHQQPKRTIDQMRALGLPV